MIGFRNKMKKDQVLQFIRRYQRFLIVIHQKPDGDCIGSALALAAALDQMKKISVIAVLDKLSEKYLFLPWSEKITEVTDLRKFLKKKIFQGLVFVDCGSLAMAGLEKAEVKKYPILNIDHHATSDNFGDINCHQSHKAATAEILYDKFIDWGISFNKNIATLLFTGIFTDTGGFQHTNTSLSVLEKASQLIKYGVKIDKISNNLLRTRSLASLKILGMTLSRIIHNKKYNIIYSVITDEDKKRYQVADEDIDGIVNMLAGSSGAKASLLLYDVAGEVKGSLRTDSDEVDVSILAKILGGGGHKKASGFKIPGKLTDNHGWQIV